MYAKGLVEEVVPPVAQLPVSTVGQRLDDSLGSWSSLELDDPAPLPPPPSGGVTGKLLKGKKQAGV